MSLASVTVTGPAVPYPVTLPTRIPWDMYPECGDATRMGDIDRPRVARATNAAGKADAETCVLGEDAIEAQDPAPTNWRPSLR